MGSCSGRRHKPNAPPAARAIKQAQHHDGKFIVHGNDDTLSAEDMALGYKPFMSVEQAWRDLKSTLDMRPVFHWAAHRIHAHVAITVLSLLLERTCQKSGLSPAWSRSPPN